MGFYDRYVLPRLIDLAMRASEVKRYRALVVPRAHGKVLEIGIGSGLNLAYYGAGVHEVAGIDPSDELLAMARRRSEDASFGVELRQASAEALPLEDGAFDCVVTTFTLCSVADPGAALREAHRALKAGGTLLFAEHGLAPDRSVARWQDRLNPAWRSLAGGCNLNRRIDAIVEASGFRIDTIDRGYAHGPKALSYVYCGEAKAL